jgi:hypothetical protein
MKSTQLVRSFLISLAALFAFAFAPQSAVLAGQPVDPSTLNPPPPPQFNPVCEKVGAGTICTVKFSDPPFAGGSGLTCGSGSSSFEPFQFQTRSVEGRRYYDRNGNLTQRHFREVLAGTFTNPLTQTSVSFAGGDTHIHNLTVPGDISTGTETMTGLFRVYLQHGGSVLIDAGRQVFAEDGTFISEAGQHPFNAYFLFGDTSAVQPLCDALE